MERTSLHHRTNFSRIQTPLKLRSIVQSKALFTLAGLGVLCFSCYFVGTAFNSRTNAWETSFFFEYLHCNIWFTKTDSMSKLDFRLLSSKPQSRFGAILQQALGERRRLTFPLPLCISYQSQQVRHALGMVSCSAVVDSQAVTCFPQIPTDIVKATRCPLYIRLKFVVEAAQSNPCLRHSVNITKDPHMLACAKCSEYGCQITWKFFKDILSFCDF